MCFEERGHKVAPEQTVIDPPLDLMSCVSAAVGPPAKVNLTPAGSDLDVFITDPLTSANTPMTEILSKMYYHILYWERSADSKVRKLSFRHTLGPCEQYCT